MAKKKPAEERSGEEYNQYIVNTPDNMNKQAKGKAGNKDQAPAEGQPIAKADEEE